VKKIKTGKYLTELQAKRLIVSCTVFVLQCPG